MHLKILAQGEDWVVVRKPSGFLVHKQHAGQRVAMVQVLRNQLGRHVWPVHRLDRGTSGCLLFALSSEAVAPLHDALAHGTKRYLAQVRGNPRWTGDQVVDSPLKVDGKLKQAHTVVRCLGGADEPRSALVMAMPTTGRRHQIRRHLNRLAHPVLGDSTHGDTRTNRTWREEQDLSRLALHCWSLELVLPGGTDLRVRAPIPRDLGRVWCAQPWWPTARLHIPADTEEAA